MLGAVLLLNYRPYFNVDFKDDKSYPYIAIADGYLPAIKYAQESTRRVRAIWSIPILTLLMRRSEK